MSVHPSDTCRPGAVADSGESPLSFMISGRFVPAAYTHAMSDLLRRLLGWGLAAAGAAVLVSPIREHRGVWQVTVGDGAPKNRIVPGGESVPSARVMFNAWRIGERRPDAEFRSALGVVLIGSGPGLSLIQATRRLIYSGSSPRAGVNCSHTSPSGEKGNSDERHNHPGNDEGGASPRAGWNRRAVIR